MGHSGAGGKLIHKKNQKQKISWHCPFKVMAILCGAAKNSLRGTGAPFQKVRALPKGAPPFSPIRQSWATLPKGACPSKGCEPFQKSAPFPIHQTVCQELRMDGGIAKPGPACKTWKRLLSYFEFFPAHPPLPVRSSSGARFLHV